MSGKPDGSEVSCAEAGGVAFVTMADGGSSRGWSIALIVVAGAFVSPLVPGAGAELRIHYVKQGSSAAAGEQTSHESPACPRGDSVASGGARPKEFGMAINSSYPLPTHRRWRVFYDNFGEETAGLTTHAVCVNREPSVRTKLASGTGRQRATVACRNGPFEPTGGGLFSFGGYGTTFLEEQGVETSADHALGGRWHTFARGPAPTSPVSIRAYGICLNMKAPRVPVDPFSDQTGAGWGQTTKACRRSERVIGGGGGTVGLSDDAYVSGSYPMDLGRDEDKKPDDGWRLYMESSSSPNPIANAQVFAICVDA